MIRDICYCANNACPFTDCGRHPENLNGYAGVFTLSDFGSVCATYLAYKDGRGLRGGQDYYLGDE